MEILRNYAGWYIHACWSDKFVIGAAMIAVIALIVYGLAKMNWSWFRIGSPWKIFRKIIFFVVIGGLVWVCYPKITLKLKLWMVERAQLAKAVEPLKKRLAVLADKATNKNGKGLPDAEAAEMQLLKEDIAAAEKKVMEGPPSQKLAFSNHKEVWNWTFRWERNDRQWEDAKKAGKKKKGEEYPARIIEKTPSYLMMEYVSEYSGKPEKVLLKISNTGGFYAANYFIKNKKQGEADLALKIILHDDPESPGNFTGIFWQDQDGQQVVCWLSKKQNSLYLK